MAAINKPAPCGERRHIVEYVGKTIAGIGDAKLSQPGDVEQPPTRQVFRLDSRHGLWHSDSRLDRKPATGEIR